MLGKKTIFVSLVGLGFLLGVASNVAVAQMPTKSSEPINQLRRTEQPLGLKAGLTLGGTALIGLELWWFLLGKFQTR